MAGVTPALLEGVVAAVIARPASTIPVEKVIVAPAKSTSALEPGTYAYYVAPYDSLTDTEGPASAVLYVDTTTYVVNHSPVARLTVDPGFAGAPAEITLDASASYDIDGSVSAYEWDFDADGAPDWLSTDPVPETSSDGTVDGITPVSPGVVQGGIQSGQRSLVLPGSRCD